MKVYLAARFSRRDELREYARELRALGVEVTSAWLDELDSKPDCQLPEFTHSFLLSVAMRDKADIDRSDVVVLMTDPPTEAHVRGAHHFELGYAFARGKQVMTVGQRENIFHYLPDVPNYATWEEGKVALLTWQYKGKEVLDVDGVHYKFIFGANAKVI